jgi:hypothetical protein
MCDMDCSVGGHSHTVHILPQWVGAGGYMVPAVVVCNRNCRSVDDSCKVHTLP